MSLNKKADMSHGKIADHFRDTYGIHLTRSACDQIVLRAGRRLKPAHEEIQQHVRQAQHVTPDETGWRLGGCRVWLHNWVADDGATCRHRPTPQRRSPAGSQEVISSVLATCTQRACNAATFIKQAICGFVGSLFARTIL